MAKRLAIHRATTIGPKSSLCQVIIKNTTDGKDVPRSASSSTINRSQSLLTTNRILVLAPPRQDRVRLENLLSDVWTRDILPFPAMTSRARGEHLVRSSANSMIRKLSVASITSNFTKRSASQTSLANLRHPGDEDFEIADNKVSYNGRYESIIRGNSEAQSTTDSEVTSQSLDSGGREKDMQHGKNTIAHNSTERLDETLGTIRGLANIRTKKNWPLEGGRMMTSPLRSNSGNVRTISGNIVPVNEVPSTVDAAGVGNEKENHFTPKHTRWTKAAGLNKGLSADGLRSLFR
jgi:hypothetical protein